MELEEIISRNQLSEIIHVTVPTLCKWGREHLIREHKVGGSVFYVKSEVLEDIQKHTASRKGTKTTGGQNEN